MSPVYHIDQATLPKRSARWYLAPVNNALEDVFAYLLDNEVGTRELLDTVEQALNDCASARVVLADLDDPGVPQ